ncbi:MAG: carbohydrate ABC transporter permease, partial [Nitrososphaerales archaeon]
MRYLRRNRSQIGIQAILLVLGILTFIPLFFLINLSLKDQFSFSSKPMSLSIPPAWSNYELAWQFMRDPLWHNVVIGLAGTSASLLMAALTAFVLGRFRFPGRNLLMGFFLLILFVPSTILLVPTFELIVRFHLQNTLWALILPYAAHQSLMIFVLQSFFAQLPAEMFDAAQMDGASVWQQFWRVAVPLALPALSAMAIFQVWWIW